MRLRCSFWWSVLKKSVCWFWGALGHGHRAILVYALLVAAGAAAVFDHLPYVSGQGKFQPPGWLWWVLLVALGSLALSEGIYAAARALAVPATHAGPHPIVTQFLDHTTAMNPGLTLEGTIPQASGVDPIQIRAHQEAFVVTTSSIAAPAQQPVVPPAPHPPELSQQAEGSQEEEE